jgi:hypothetical protein
LGNQCEIWWKNDGWMIKAQFITCAWLNWIGVKGISPAPYPRCLRSSSTSPFRNQQSNCLFECPRQAKLSAVIASMSDNRNEKSS